MIIIRKQQELCGNIIQAIDANGTITDFPGDNNNIALFKVKTKIAGRTGNYGPKDVKILKWYHENI